MSIAFFIAPVFRICLLFVFLHKELVDREFFMVYSYLMLIFCADSSGSFLSFALAEEDSGTRTLVDSAAYPAEGRMNECFFSAMERFFTVNSRTVHDVDEWVAVTGPGSFTGIRIGMAGVSGICSALGKELFGISALDAAALVSGESRLTAAAKIKLNEYACRTYDFILPRYSDLSVVTADELPGDVIMAGSSSLNLAEAVADARCGFFIQKAVPLYVKRSEAEINFDKKSNRQ